MQVTDEGTNQDSKNSINSLTLKNQRRKTSNIETTQRGRGAFHASMMKDR